MQKLEDRIGILLTAESFMAAILLLYLSGHIDVYAEYIEKYTVHSLAVYLSIFLYVASIFTLIRSIALAFQCLHCGESSDQEKFYWIAFDLFLMVLMAVGIGVFVSFFSVTRMAFFKAPHLPIQDNASPLLYLGMFVFMLMYIVILILRPTWITRPIRFLRTRVIKLGDSRRS